MVLDAALALGRLGTGLGEVEDERTARERELVAVFQRVDEVAGLVRRLEDGPIPLGALQVELEQQRELARLGRAVGAVGCGAAGRSGARAPARSGRSARRCSTSARCSGESADARVALHLDEAARDDAAGDVEVEEPEVGPRLADLVAQLVGCLLQHAVQLEVRVERNDDLVLEAPWCSR